MNKLFVKRRNPLTFLNKVKNYSNPYVEDLFDDFYDEPDNIFYVKNCRYRLAVRWEVLVRLNSTSVEEILSNVDLSREIGFLSYLDTVLGKALEEAAIGPKKNIFKYTRERSDMVQ